MTRKRSDPDLSAAAIRMSFDKPSFAPFGWETAQGQLLPIGQNQSLFSLLGTFYGGGGPFAPPDTAFEVQARDPFKLEAGETGWGRTFDLGSVRGPVAQEGADVGRFAGESKEAGELFAEGHSELAFLGRFAERVILASVYLASAFAQANVHDFKPTRRRPAFKSRGRDEGWNAGVANTVLKLFWELREALAHSWKPSVSTFPLARQAFMLLAEITPAHSALNRLYALDSERAFRELGRQMDIVAEQVRLGISLVADLETAEMSDEAAANEERLAEIQNAILADTGETIKLGAAADRLGTSRQNLHQRIRRGSAIGVLKGGEIIVPTSQFVKTRGKEKIVDGLSMIIGPFLESGAGHWSALQYLVDVEPNLGVSPLDALKAGAEPKMIAHLADAYLGHCEQEEQTVDEG